ncbi:MmgE/PrpD family protein [Terribacillus saccharophilus]|uniref:MmgE/PrpD family protein n=1 Tax=Terribacillus saccharophilus TaxID=361277 RepID=UPI003981B215
MKENNYTAQFVAAIYKSAPLISEVAVSEAKKGVLDFLASCFAAKDEKSVQNLVDFTLAEGGTPTAPVIGQHTLTSDLQAAFLNGFIGHYLDFDDVHAEVRGHPSTVILPALLALASCKNMSYRHFLNSYIIGVETMARIGRTIGAWHYERGWHNTSTLGSIGAAAATSFALQLPQEKFAVALGIAATQSSGLRGQFGTEVKPLHAGLAARNGLLATKIAESGAISGSSTMLENFYSVYSENKKVPEDLAVGWGLEWSIVSPGLWFKIYPCCSAAYHTIDAAKKLRQNHSISLDDIAAVNIVFPTGGDAALISTHPKTGEEGRFSAEYVCAIILTEGKITAHHFDAREPSKKIKELMRKMQRVYSKSIRPAPHAVPKGRFTIVEVETKHGEVYTARCDAPEGSSANPLSVERLHDKLAQHVPCSIPLQTLVDCIQKAEYTAPLIDLLKEK